MLTTEAKLAVIKEYATHEGDTGSPEVQVAILTSRIQYLTDHLKEHKKDYTLSLHDALPIDRKSVV